MKNKSVLYITQAAIIAALYVVLTMAISAFNLANGAIQVRISEVLTILPFFTPAAIPGLFIGCLLSNIFTGCALPDIIFGSLATLVAAILSRKLRKNQWLVPIPPIVLNMLVVPFVLRYAYGAPDAIWFMMLTVGAGEVISCGILGSLLLNALKPIWPKLSGKHAA